jgi:predicted DNA binding CopG/RHH family protein
MKKLKSFPKKIPKFNSYEEEATFWDTHDTSTVINSWKPARLTFAKPLKHLMSIRIDMTLFNGIRMMAAKKHMPYQTLIHAWLAEKLSELHKKST